MKASDPPATNRALGGEGEGDLLELQSLLHALAPRLTAYLDRQMPPELRPFVEPPDVLQDTFFEAFRRWGEFKEQGEDAPFRWMATIARNRLLALLRAKRALKRGGHRDRDGELVRVVAMLEELAVYERTPSQSALSHEAAAAVQRCLGRLEPQYREAIRLRYIDGLSLEQAASRMGRTPGAVTMLCNRGLKAMRSDLQSDSLSV